MGIYETLQQNGILYVFITGIIIVAFSTIIYLKTKKLYDLSQHRGLEYFSNAFLFFAIGFGMHIISGIIFLSQLPTGPIIFPFTVLAFFYCLIIAAFYLIFSLLWKKIHEKICKPEDSISTQNRKFRILVYSLHALAVLIAISAIFFGSSYILFIPALLAVGASIIFSYNNYANSATLSQKNSRRIFFISIILVFIGFAINFVGVAFVVQKVPEFIIIQDLVTVIVFGLLLYAVLRSIRFKW